MPVWSLLSSCLRRAGLLRRQTRRRGQRPLSRRTFRPVLELLEARLPPGQLFGNLGVTPKKLSGLSVNCHHAFLQVLYVLFPASRLNNNR